MYFEGVKVVFVCFVMYDVKDFMIEKYNYFESIFLCYECIIWKYCDGNIIFIDFWVDR